jgi:hypothetical protein
MSKGQIFGNYATKGDGGGGGVEVNGNGSTFTMSDTAEIFANTTNTIGGGVLITDDGSFEKSGGTINGKNSSTNLNTAFGDTYGHAVFYRVGSAEPYTRYYRDDELGTSDSVNTSTDTLPTSSGQTNGYWTMW